MWRYAGCAIVDGYHLLKNINYVPNLEIIGINLINESMESN